MPRGKRTEDTTILSMALIGYETEKQRIEGKINEIRALLGGGRPANNATARPATASASAPSSSPASSAPASRKRTLSAAARKRIAAAQKKRWAEHRKKMAKQG
jgi:hypothetical protein